MEVIKMFWIGLIIGLIVGANISLIFIYMKTIL